MLFLKNDMLKVVKLNLLKMGRPITMAHQSREEKEDNCNEVDEVFLSRSIQSNHPNFK